MQISLSKALKVKNRIASEIKDLQQIIHRNNSYIVGNTPEFDVNDTFNELMKQQNLMTELKVKINNANAQIINQMVELSEMKSHITFLRGIRPQDGMIDTRYDGSLTEMKSVYNAQVMRAKVKEAQTKIDLLQDEIDKYNASTTIEFSQS